MADIHNKYYGNFVHAVASSINFTPPQKIHLPSLVKEIFNLRAESEKEKRPVFFFPNLESPEDIVAYYRDPLKSVCGSRCDITNRSLSISPTGTISLGQRCFHHNLGNIRTHDLKKVLQNDLWLQEFRKKITDAGGYFPACTRCCGGMKGKLQYKEFAWNNS